MNEFEDIASQYSPEVIEALAKKMEEMAGQPRDTSNRPERVSGTLNSYARYRGSANPPETCVRPSLSDCGVL